MARLAGTLTGGDGKPLANYNLILVATKTSSQVINTADTLIVLTATGGYSFDCKPGEYLVTLSKEGRAATIAGKLNVYADSPAGTLNDYMGALSGELTPEIVRRVQEIIAAANAAVADVIAKVDKATADVEKISADAQALFDSLSAELDNQLVLLKNDMEEFKADTKQDINNVVAESLTEINSIRDEVANDRQLVIERVAANELYAQAMNDAASLAQSLADSGVKTFNTMADILAYLNANSSTPDGTVFRLIAIGSEQEPLFLRYSRNGAGERVFQVVGGDLAPGGLRRFQDRLDQVVQNQFVPLTNDEDIVFVVTDPDGNTTWLQARGSDGGPTKWAISMLNKAMGVNNTQEATAEGEQIFYAITDEQGFLTDLSIRESDGQFSEFVVKRLAQRIKTYIGGNDGGGSAEDKNLRIDNNSLEFGHLLSFVNGTKRKAENIPLPSNPNNFDLGQNRAFRITRGDAYDNGKLSTAIVYCGGLNGTNLDWRSEFSGLKPANMVWAAGNFSLNQYGSPLAMADVGYLISNLFDNYNVGAYILFGNSMGGMTACNALLTQNTLPKPAGLYLVDPMVNLSDRWNSERKEIIRAAYGINSSGSDYNEKTAGYDPMLHHWSHFKGIPVRIIASTGDTTVPYNSNAKALSDKLSGHTDVSLKTLTSAGHNTADRYDQSDLLLWITQSVIKTNNVF